MKFPNSTGIEPVTDYSEQGIRAVLKFMSKLIIRAETSAFE